MTAFCSPGSDGDQSPGSQSVKINRQPYAAGRFYTDDTTELRKELKELFAEAIQKKFNNVFAVIAPHAGYIYSGEVAASAFNQIDNSRSYENIFIIASSHRQYFDGASIYNIGDYLTPLGTVTVNTTLADRLIAENKVFAYSPRFHDQEHSLEVQLPFLQHKFGKNISLVPIIVGTDGPETCMKIARALKPYLKPENLFIISSDFSHYPSYADAVVTDKKTAEAIVSNNPDRLMKTLAANEEAKTAGLATSLCGYTSVLSLLYMTKDIPGVSAHEIQYKNSGDSRVGDKSRVVGYNAIIFDGMLAEEKKPEGMITPSEKKELLKIARQTLESYLSKGDIPNYNTAGMTSNMIAELGAFVTLKKSERLRGCIGRFTADEPLYKIVQKMAISAATEDTRFSKVTFEELDKLHIEISVLTPLKKITSPDEIQLGKHGIYMRKGYRTGTFLPQVATETGWSKEEFLGHCAEDKAGIGWHGWKDAELYTYEAIVFGE
ncbi:MAG: AmmeMemoRadiSam system protein B [Bacteroidales bacterium]